jgi:hypothetical protein
MAIIDETLCIASSAATLRAAIEASYLLGFSPPDAWITARYSLSLPKASVGNGIILRSRADSANVLPEVPLSVLLEPIGSLVETELALNVKSSILSNFSLWTSEAVLASSIGRDTATRRLIRLHAHALAMQTQSNLSQSFLERLEEFLEEHDDGPGGFGSLGLVGKPNDIGIAARFLSVFLFGLAGATVCGGVGQSGEAYASFGLNLSSSAVLPEPWERMRVGGLGPSKIDAVLLNRGLATTGGLGVGVFGSSNLAYWSTDALIL